MWLIRDFSNKWSWSGHLLMQQYHFNAMHHSAEITHTSFLSTHRGIKTKNLDRWRELASCPKSIQKLMWHQADTCCRILTKGSKWYHALHTTVQSLQNRRRGFHHRPHHHSLYWPNCQRCRCRRRPSLCRSMENKNNEIQINGKNNLPMMALLEIILFGVLFNWEPAG